MLFEHIYIGKFDLKAFCNSSSRFTLIYCFLIYFKSQFRCYQLHPNCVFIFIVILHDKLNKF